jgi:hypothetical protein
MKPPRSKLVVGGCSYRFTHEKIFTDDDDPRVALTDERMGIIYLEPRVNDDVAIPTIVHEWLHTEFSRSGLRYALGWVDAKQRLGIDHEEAVTDFLGYAIVESLRNNLWLVKLIVEGPES